MVLKSVSEHGVYIPEPLTLSSILIYMHMYRKYSDIYGGLGEKIPHSRCFESIFLMLKSIKILVWKDTSELLIFLPNQSEKDNKTMYNAFLSAQ